MRITLLLNGVPAAPFPFGIARAGERKHQPAAARIWRRHTGGQMNTFRFDAEIWSDVADLLILLTPLRFRGLRLIDFDGHTCVELDTTFSLSELIGRMKEIENADMMWKTVSQVEKAKAVEK